MTKMSNKIRKFESNERKYKVLEKGKAAINSLISFLKESIDRVTQLIKGAINGDVGTIIEFLERIAGAIEKVEENSRSKAYLKNLGNYAKVSHVEIFKEGSVLVIRDRVTIPLADRIKEMRSFKAFWVTSADKDKLVKPMLERENVIINNNLTMEVTNEELKKCIVA